MPMDATGRLTPTMISQRATIAGPIMTRYRHSHRGTFGTLAAVWLLLLGGRFGGAAEDSVICRRVEGSGETRRTGEILDFTGEFLTLRGASGREEQIPSSRVLRYETTRVRDHENADQLFREARFPDAVVAYRRAVDEEQRGWMRRQILASMVRCHTNMNQPDRAGDTFLIIVRIDPTTQWFDAIPLSWKPQQTTGPWEQRASDWLDNPPAPAAALMGASWLLSSSRRDRAREALRQLAADPDPRIALLAQAQLCRAELFNNRPDTVSRLESTVAALDHSLRAGPYFLLGHAWARQSDPGRAALAFLRVPILHAEQADLAAESLWLAGDQLQLAGNRDGAATVYRELTDRHPQHLLAPLARQKLQEMAQ